MTIITNQNIKEIDSLSLTPEQKWQVEWHKKQPITSDIKCECNLNSMNNPNPKEDYSEEEQIGMYHLPNECKCLANLKQYKRRSDGITRWLCSCCNMPWDDEEAMEKSK